MKVDYTKKIDEVLDSFDFSKVEKFMIDNGWKWTNGKDNPMTIPDKIRIYKTAKRLLEDAVKNKGTCGTGGLVAEFDKHNGELSLSFNAVHSVTSI